MSSNSHVNSHGSDMSDDVLSPAKDQVENCVLDTVTKQVENVGIPSEGMKVNQGHELHVPSVTRESHACKLNNACSDNYETPKALGSDSLSNCDDVCVASMPKDLSLFNRGGSNEQNEVPGLADQTNHQKAGSCSGFSDNISSTFQSSFMNYIDLQKESQIYENPTKFFTNRKLLTRQLGCNKQQSCKFCGKVFLYKKLYLGHVKRMHPDNYKDIVKPKEPRNCKKAHVCETCGKVFSYRTLYQRHVTRVHSIIKPHICDKCKKSFLYACDLAHHIQIHTGYKCSVCDMVFNKKSLFRKHKWQHKGVTEKELRLRLVKCEFCKKSYSATASGVVRHRRICTMEKEFRCTVCQKRFAHQSQLNAHVKVHGELEFSCTICLKMFVLESYLRKHMMTHEADRAYMCSECGHGSISQSDLNRHRASHSEDRAYSCTVCKKSFKQMSNLTEHMKTHTGGLYKCRICATEFSRRRSLANHRKTAHSHAADLAPRKFPRTKLLAP